MNRKERIKERNEKILQHFNKLRGERERNVPKYTYIYCLEKTGEKFYLSSATIEKIIIKTK